MEHSEILLKPRLKVHLTTSRKCITELNVRSQKKMIVNKIKLGHIYEEELIWNPGQHGYEAPRINALNHVEDRLKMSSLVIEILLCKGTL